MNANSVKLPLVVRIALWLWIVTSLGGAIYCFIFEGEVDYKEPLRLFDEVLIQCYYKCEKCGHKYIPTYNSMLWSMHMGRIRYIQCPNCHKKSWNKKVLK